jgi:GNAT superfamily N-acetyltransferase
VEITYQITVPPPVGDIIELYKSSGINRPVADEQRIQQMYEHSNLVVTAWHGRELVGIARCLTDFCYCCYLSDLAVSKPFQKLGIGKSLVQLTKDHLGPTVTLILLAAPEAINYYGKIGMASIDNAFMIRRTK